MVGKEGDHEGEKDGTRCSAPGKGRSPSAEQNGSITGIIDERIESLREAIEEIDAALESRKELNNQFLKQIDREAEEVKRHLDMLPAPWTTGFQPEHRFLGLSSQRRPKSDKYGILGD